MNPIIPYRISSNYNAADNADENDARNKRDAKRKLVSGPPVMRQAERKNTEKLLSEAMHLASYKSQNKLEKITQSQVKESQDLHHTVNDSESVLKLAVKEDFSIDSSAVELVSASEFTEDVPLQLSYFSKKLIEIESSISGKNRRTNPAVMLGYIENIATQLSNQEKICELIKEENTKADSSTFDHEEMSCSIDFIEGYYEASSFSEDIKNKILSELSKIKDLIGNIEDLITPLVSPLVIPEASVIKYNNATNTRSSDYKPMINRIKNNSLEKNIRKPKKEKEKHLTNATVIPLGFIRNIF